ncbi:MLO 13 [Olea europaea subsp. europaea]|uniref:MLO 13 n=1 Tax=Olea europaea subsp. europaea TaxID=158383 RepID=A0A8S0UZI5_OLEEU|nr:MLO 13 [Olea europaea subsp. europaea]
MVDVGGQSFEHTPTWVVALVCFVIVLISFCTKRGLHHLDKSQDALYKALQTLKEELMLLGFISVLLTVFQGLIIDICIPANLATIMPPRKWPETSSLTGSHLLVNNGRRLEAEAASANCCEAIYIKPFLTAVSSYVTSGEDWASEERASVTRSLWHISFGTSIWAMSGMGPQSLE